MMIFDSYVSLPEGTIYRISIYDANPYQQVNVAYTVLSTRALLK